MKLLSIRDIFSNRDKNGLAALKLPVFFFKKVLDS